MELFAQSIKDIPNLVDESMEILKSSEGKKALQNFRDYQKENAASPNRILYSQSAVGDTLDFNVRTYVLTDSAKWLPKTFVLQHEGSDFYLWAELRELINGNITSSDIDVLVERIGSQTPLTSINPNQGILQNNHEVFGDPPNYDGDGKVDILLHDIDEGVPNLVVAGSVNPADVDPNAPAGHGNQRDVIYLDTNPILRSFGPSYVSVFVAHEYQHLIHFNYDIDEVLFINEGLSELAIHVNGFTWRSTDYLSDPENPYYNIPLLSFLGGGDYGRAALFFSYLIERFGLEATASLTKSPLHGADGLRDAIPDGSLLGLEDVIEKFHIANYLNDKSQADFYGYDDLRRASPVRVELPLDKKVDGNDQTSIDTQRVDIEPGGVEYFDFTSVQNITFQLRSSGVFVDQIRSSVFLFHLDGQKELIPIEANGLEVEFVGEFQQVVLITSNVLADGGKSSVEYDAAWSSSGAVTTVVYDNGQILSGKSFVIDLALNESDRRMAEITTVFEVPTGGSLLKLGLTPYFMNQFSNGGQDASRPRDFTLNIRDDDRGRPGDIIYSKVVVDPRPHAYVTSVDLEFLNLEMAQHRSEIGYPLPDRIHVGVADAGIDANRIVAQTSRHVGPNTSFFLAQDPQGSPAFYPLQNLEYTTTAGARVSFEETTYPIRATFLIDPSAVSNETTEIAGQPDLVVNYPNPFSEWTILSFNLREAQEVLIRIFDVNGRLIQSLDSGFLNRGRHELEIREDNWPNGLYIFELHSSTGVQRGSMMHSQ